MHDIPKVILWMESSRGVGRSLMRGIARYSRLHGPWAFYSEPGGQDRSLPQLKHWGANGIIAHVPNRTEAQRVLTADLPLIIKGANLPGIPTIVTDNTGTGRLAADSLANRGFRNFAYCGNADQEWSQDRGDSFAARLKELGHEAHLLEQPAGTDDSWEEQQEQIAQWLQSLPKPLAVLAANDDHGRHVVEACKVARIHVPDEVAVLGVDNDTLVCDLCGPPLASIAMSIEQAGYEAAELMDRMMRGETQGEQQIVIKPLHVVNRQSNDILAIEDRYVARAVRFIRENTLRPIQVNDVAAATDLSRRVLEKRFRKELNCSIFKEVRRARVAQIQQMLLETDLSVSAIAELFGFPGSDHIARFFRSEVGVSLVEYRRQHRQY